MNDSDSGEPVAPDSPEGQLILVEAVRSLERRLSPETRATLCEVKSVPSDSSLKSIYAYLQCSFHSKQIWTYFATRILRRSSQSQIDSAGMNCG